MKKILLGFLISLSYFLVGCGQRPLSSDEFMEINLEASRQAEGARIELRESGQMYEYLTERFNTLYTRASSTYSASRIREISLENDVNIIEIDIEGNELTWDSNRALDWLIEESEINTFTVTIIHPLQKGSNFVDVNAVWDMSDVYTIHPFETILEFQNWADENGVELRVSMLNSEGVFNVHSFSHSAPGSTPVINDHPYTLGVCNEGNFAPDASLTISIEYIPDYWAFNFEWFE